MQLLTIDPGIDLGLGWRRVAGLDSPSHRDAAGHLTVAVGSCPGSCPACHPCFQIAAGNCSMGTQLMARMLVVHRLPGMVGSVAVGRNLVAGNAAGYVAGYDDPACMIPGQHRNSAGPAVDAESHTCPGCLIRLETIGGVSKSASCPNMLVKTDRDPMRIADDPSRVVWFDFGYMKVVGYPNTAAADLGAGMSWKACQRVDMLKEELDQNKCPTVRQWRSIQSCFRPANCLVDH